jgi:ABC-type Fe3+/spermidine/putrescine transport system ATPase subunit
MALELRELSKSYGSLQVLHPTTLDIANGEFLTLLGPSGSGKTTVLRLIGGFTAPSGGRIAYDGRDMTHLSANQRPFNTVFQDYALFPHMTVVQNVSYGPLVQRRSMADAAKLIGETLDIVGLSEFRDRYPSQLSGGQKQRVALARAIVCEPKVILLDEPLAALDANLRRQMQLFLKQIQRRIRTTFVFVTHDQDEAITMSDRIVVMNQGRIEQVGSPQELYYRPRTRFVAGFFGDNNLIEGVLIAPQTVDTTLGRLPVSCTQMPAGRKVLLSIRPESFRLGKNDHAVSATVEEAMFGGASTRLLLRPDTASELKLDVRLPGDRRHDAPRIGERVSVTYDPIDAVIVES